MGHFPEKPVRLGVLILEGMAQTSGVLAMRTKSALAPATDTGEAQIKLSYLVGVKRAGFHKPVLPGDRLVYEAKLTKVRGNSYHAEVITTVEGRG